MSLAEWINQCLSRGKSAFSSKEVRKAFPADSEAALTLKLTRLTRKGKILSVHQGYYIIISPQYAAKGILPPVLFIDGLMRFLERPYYVGLLNAAAFYGAAHQQPQEYYVFTNEPALRAARKKNIKINYVSKKKIPAQLLEKRKTETGYLTVSSPELTAADLLQFDKRIGGLNRAATVLYELAEAIRPEKLNEDFLRQIPVATIQRLGYLLEKVVQQPELAGHLLEQSRKATMRFFRIPLRSSYPTKGFSTDEKWKVVINTQIEIDQ